MIIRTAWGQLVEVTKVGIEDRRHFRYGSGVCIVGRPVWAHDTPRDTNERLCGLLYELDFGYKSIAEARAAISEMKCALANGGNVYSFYREDDWV